MLPQPNVVVKKGKRWTSVEVGGVKMAGVVGVTSEHSGGETGTVTITLTGRMVEFDQRHETVEGAVAAAIGKLGQVSAQMERERAEHARELADNASEIDRLRSAVAEKQRFRVAAPSRPSCG